MNGMYELNLNLVDDFLYEQSYLSNYKISLLKDQKINSLTIHELKNDILIIEDANISSNSLDFSNGTANIPIRIIIRTFKSKVFNFSIGMVIFILIIDNKPITSISLS